MLPHLTNPIRPTPQANPTHNPPANPTDQSHPSHYIHIPSHLRHPRQKLPEVDHTVSVLVARLDDFVNDLHVQVLVFLCISNRVLVSTSRSSLADTVPFLSESMFRKTRSRFSSRKITEFSRQQATNSE